MIDKNAQRARVAQFELEQLAQGKTVPVLPAFKVTTVVVPPKVASPAKTPNKKVANYVRKVKGRLEEPFTNSIGQVINVGDKVVAVSQGYNKSIKVRVATYVGLRKDQQGRVTSVSVSGEVTENKWDWRTRGYRNTTVVRTSSLPSKRIFKSS